MLEEEAQKHAHGGTAFVIIARALGVIGICLGAAEVTTIYRHDDDDDNWFRMVADC